MADELIKLDMSKIAAGLMERIPTKDDKARFLKGLAANAMQAWISEAKRRLKSTSRDYVGALSVAIKDDSAVITLDASEKHIVHLVENGMQGGDMRKWMLSGPKVKQGKNGRYLVIPFRHGSAGSSGRNAGAAMPASIHHAAKQLEPTLSRPEASAPKTTGGRTVMHGERLHPGLEGIKPKAKKILNTKVKPWHGSSIYKGMIKQQKTYAKGTGSKYSTFRVISENVTRGKKDKDGSALEHWYHPGIRAVHLAEYTQGRIRLSAARILASTLK